MSERTHAPRPGGRAADPQRGTTGRRNTGLSRDADAQDAADRTTADARRSAARGVRRFADEDGPAGPSDQRRAGTGRRETSARRDTDRVRGEARDAEGAQGKARDTGGVRGKARDTEGVRAKARDTGGVRGRARDTGDVRGRARDTGEVRSRARDEEAPRVKTRDTEGVRARARDTGVRGKARDTDSVRAQSRASRERNGESPLGRGWNVGSSSRSGMPASRDRKGSLAGRRSRMADALGGRGRAATPAARGPLGRNKADDAPVDGSAALQIEVTAAEPLRVTKPESAALRLRVAPPAPISAPRAPFVATVLGVVIVGVLGILLINTKTNENSFRITDLQKQNTALENQQQDLENQLVAASSIGNLDAAARRLGMVKAEKLALFRLPDGKIIGVPTPTLGKVAITAQDPKNGGTTGDKGAGNVVPADGTVQQGDTPAGQTGQTQTGQTQTGQGQTQTGQGQTQTGQGQTGQGQTGQTQTQTGQGQTGQTQTGQTQTEQGQNQQNQTQTGQTTGQAGQLPGGTGQ